MEVLTYLKSTLAIAACLSVIFLVLRHVVRRESGRRDERTQEGSFLVATSSLSREENKPPSAPVGAVHPELLAEFVCQYTPPETDLHVYSKIALFAPSVFPIHVHKGGHLLLLGTAVGNVSVRTGGIAVVYGLVVGEVLNEGGQLQVFGRIIGKLTETAGSTCVHASSQITNVP